MFRCARKGGSEDILTIMDRYADEHCSSLGGSLVVPRNEEENLEVVDIAEDYYQVKGDPL